MYVYPAFQIEIFHEVFEHFARIALFIEQAIMDESLETGDRDFKTALQKIETNIYRILCQVKVILHEQGHRLKSRISRSILDQEIRIFVNHSKSRQRDYIVLNKARSILLLTSKDMEQLINDMELDSVRLDSENEINIKI